MKTALILVDHGSRLEAANRMLEEVAALVREQAPEFLTIAAHMEIAEPTIKQAVARAAEAGAKEIVFFPYFLSPGLHSSEDIPRIAAEALAPYPDISHSVADPFGPHPLVVQIIRDRVDAARGAK